MKRSLLPLPAALAFVALACSAPATREPEPIRPPAGWFLSGSDPSSFTLTVDRIVKHAGTAGARLDAVQGASGTGTVVQSTAPDAYRGKRLRFSAAAKTEGVTGWTGLWMRVDGPEGRRAGFDNMQNRPLRGTTRWARHAIVLDVPEDATRVSFGLLQDGAGSSWIDDCTLELVDERVPLTSADTRARALQDGDFELPGDRLEGWFMSGGARSAFEAVVDRGEHAGGTASGRLQPRVPAPSGYGTLMQSFRADDYRGKRLRMTAQVKGREITGRGDLWLRVQAVDSPGDGPGLGGAACKLSASFDWKPCELVFEVPEEGDAIELGVGLGGPGTIWVDDVRLEAVGSDVPLTHPDMRARAFENGDFEAGGEPPRAWFVEGGASRDFRAVTDRSDKHGGTASARLEPVREPKGYGTLLQSVAAEDYRGKRLRMTAYAKGRGITGRGDVWLRVQARTSPGDGPGLGGGRCVLAGTFDWKPCEVVFDVPQRGHSIQLGFGLGGPGTAWLDDVTFEEVGADVPLTPRPARTSDMPLELQNGDFEAAGDAPRGWFMSGGAPKDYAALVDRAERHGGLASARLRPVAARPNGYGTLMQAVRADAYRGQRLRMTASVKGEAIAARGDLWLRVQAVDSPGDGPGLGGGSCRLSQGFDWKPCEIVFDVPERGDSIQLGIGLAGTGTIWLDDVRLEAVGPSVPPSDPDRPRNGPVNLDFEEPPR